MCQACARRGVGRGVAVFQTPTVLTALPFWRGEMEHRHMVLQVMMRAWNKGLLLQAGHSGS